MTGLDKIKEKVMEDAKASAKAILNKTDETINAMRKKALDEAENNSKKALDQAEKNAEEIKRNAEIQAFQQDKNARLLLRRELITRSFDETLKALGELPLLAYFALILELILKNEEQGNGVLILSRTDKRRMPDGFLLEINKSLKKGGRVIISEESGDEAGGFILIYGDIAINCTFRTLLKDNKEKLEDILVKILLF